MYFWECKNCKWNHKSVLEDTLEDIWHFQRAAMFFSGCKSKINTSAHPPSGTFIQEAVGRVHNDVCMEERAVSHLSYILLEMTFCLKQMPTEPCQTVWLCNNSKGAETCQNYRSSFEHTAVVTTPSELTAMSPHQFIWQWHYLPGTIVIIHFIHISPLESILRSSHTNHFVRLSEGEIFSLKCMCCLPPPSLLSGEITVRQKQ